MVLQKSRIHLLVFSGCLAGYSWLFLHLANPAFQKQETGICILKHTTGIPCPSCGSTRAVLSILNGDFSQAFHCNPLGFILALLLILLPLWLLKDLLQNDHSLLRSYTKTESLLKKKKIAIPMIILILLNWYWNIHKDL